MQQQLNTAANKFHADVVNETSAKIRSFLYELAEGTSNYKSLHNLTEQVEHQYHGRFLIELMQNAHDALREKFSPDNNARIEIVLNPDDGPHGSLYVANDGKPFSESNFRSLSQLGQSDKDPQESIGNKGIGFRSILEITTSPEIYSRSSIDSMAFDGYCFSFSPTIIEQLRNPIIELFNSDDKTPSPIDSATTLVDWGAEILQKFRTSIKPKGKSWLASEMKYLSPYLLPFPVSISADNSTLLDFQNRGFVTVIRFPLKSATALKLAQEKLEEMDVNTILFLERAASLILDSGNTRRELLRERSRKLPGIHNGQEVIIHDTEDAEPHTYWLWSESIKTSDSSDEFKNALSELPGKWSELKEAVITLAVRVGENPEKGLFSIFLPTGLATGCATHISAPFFGDMSRTDIDFKNAYNRSLLNVASSKALDIVISDLSGNGLDEARAILDLLSPLPEEKLAGTRWFELLKKNAETRGIKLHEERFALSDQGWDAFENTSQIPSLQSAVVLSDELIRKHACFPAFVQGLSGRKALLESIFSCFNIDQYPLDSQKADTAESIAKELFNIGEDVDWNGFWSDTIPFLKDDSTPLKGKGVLLGTDNALHASGDECSVFFIPRQGGVDDEEVLNEGALHEIPSGLKDYVAFLHEDIQVYDERDARVQTPIRKFLDTKLVQRFRVEDILTSVLIRRTPKLPVPLKSPDSALCRDILLWGLSLVSSLVDRGKGEKTLRLLKSLPVPCRGGWYELREASFGPGWRMTLGKPTHDYLKGSGSSDCREALKKLLLPPTDESWGRTGEKYQHLLIDAGVFNGLRLSKVDPKNWPARFLASVNSFHLPDNTPIGIDQELWKAYNSHVSRSVKLLYSGFFTYEMLAFSVIPGLEEYATYDETTRISFMHILLGSITKWGDTWEQVTFKKTDGNPDSTTVLSPVVYALRRLLWLGIENDETIEWSKPSDRWYITCERLSGKPKLFAHLKPLSGRLAQRLDSDPLLAAALKKLGMPKFDTEARSESPRLLNDLAAALNGDITELNIFLGQVRDAWGAFDPAAGGAFPRKVVIRHGNNPLTVHTLSPENPVYLPDSSVSFIDALEQFSLPVVAINTSDAKRLSASFKAAYGDGIQLASKLEMIPLVNREKWEGSCGTLLVDSDLEWLIPMLLTLVAFTGVQAKGTNSEPFLKRVQMFREARMCWVSSLEAGLFKDEEVVVSPSVPAIWLDKEKVLLVTEECREHPHLLSEALALLIHRDDLELPIKLALKEIKDCEPELSEIKLALTQLKISEHQYLEAREQWRGDLGQLIRMIRPLVMVLRLAADIGKMIELETEEAVITFLNKLNISDFDGIRILSLARSSRNSHKLGMNFYKTYGDGAQLSIWNTKLIQLGEPKQENINAFAEFKSHIASAYLPLRSLLAENLRRSPQLGTFLELSEQFDGVKCPLRFHDEFWEVSFNMAIQELLSIFESWNGTPEELAAIQSSLSSEDLRNKLSLTGVDMDFDPLFVANANRDSLKRLLQRFQRIGLAWSLQQKISNTVAWERGAEQFIDFFSAALDESGYIYKWNEETIFNLLKILPRDESHAQFWLSVDVSTNIECLLNALALSSQDLEEAQAKLDDFKEQIRRQKKLISVCGNEFDGSDDNLASLWSHICEGITDTDLDTFAAINLQSSVHLKPVISKRKKSEKVDEGNKPKPFKGHLSKSMENIIGLSGEIHAFRMLLKNYGSSVVHQGAWVSGNSNHVFPENKADDGRGCDFVINHNGKTYCIEVKASQGDDETFKLGSSEIRLSMDLAKKKKTRKEIFQILHVTNALTKNPSFRLLPNPYDQKYQSYFVVEDADARVRYKHSSTTS